MQYGDSSSAILKRDVTDTVELAFCVTLEEMIAVANQWRLKSPVHKHHHVFFLPCRPQQLFFREVLNRGC